MARNGSHARSVRARRQAAAFVVEQLENRLLLSSTAQGASLESAQLLSQSPSAGSSAPAAAQGQPTLRSAAPADSGALQTSALSTTVRQVLVQGLSQMKTLAPALVGGAAWSVLLPLVNQSIASQIDAAGLVSTLLQPAINSLGGSQAMSSDDLVALLKQAAINAGSGVSAAVGAVTGGLDSVNNQFLFHAPVTATRTLSVRLDAGQAAGAMGITAGTDATISVTLTVSLDLTFGVNLNNGVPSDHQFFIRLGALTGSATVNASNINAGIGVGLLKGSIVNGSASLNAQIQVGLNNADTSGDVTYAQLLATPAAQLFAVQTTGSALATLPLTATLAGLPISGTPTITLQSSDPFAGRAMTVGTNSAFGALAPFENASTTSILSLLKALVPNLTQLGKAADQGAALKLLGTTIPFTGGKTVRDLLSLGQTFQDKVVTPLTAANGAAAFSDAQSLLTALAQALGAGAAAHYDATTHRLTFSVNLAENFAALNVPITFDVSTGSLAGISSSSTVTITPGASLNMTVGIDLTPAAATLTAGAGLPANGRLPGDAHFYIDLGAATSLNGSNVPVSVTVPADASNQSIDDLVADVNTALSVAGLGALVVAGRSGNRLTLATTYSSTAASLSVQLSTADPAATALGLVNGSNAVSDASTDRLILQNATARGTIALATPGGINASARFGFLGVGISNGSATASAEADISLQDPVSHSASGLLTLTEIAAALANPASVISSLNVSGSANASLPISVTPSIAGATLSGSPALSIAIADIKNLAGAVVTAPQLGNLSSLANMTFANALAGLNQLLTYLQSLAPLPEFGGKLPLINKSVNDLLGYSQKLLNVIQQIADSPDSTLQALGADLNARLAAAGVQTASVALSLDNDAIKAAIHYQPLDFSGSEPFSLSLADLANLLPDGSAAKALINGVGDIAEVGASGSVSANASADLELDLGIRLTTDPQNPARGPFTPFIYDSTHVSLTAQLDATNLNANANLGPVGLFIQNGSAHLTKQTRPLVESPAEIGLTLPSIAGHRYYFDQVAIVQPTLQGQMSVDLPMATPTVADPVGDLIVSADLSNIAGTLNVQSPDLADALKNFNLLSNLGVIVDGLDSLLGLVKDGLNDLSFAKSLPLIGDHLQDAFTFIDDLRGTLRNTLAPLVNNPVGNAVTQARQLIAAALGNALSDTNGDGKHDASDVPVTQTDSDGDGIVDKVEFELPIDEQVTASVPFDLGLPALNLHLAGNVLVTAGFHLDLKFGVSAADGFFIDTSYPQGVHAVTANVSVALPATLSGTLGFLHVNVQDLGLANGNSADATKFSTGLTLDLKTPPGAGSSILPFTDLVSGLYSPGDLASLTLSGSAAVNLRLAVDFGDEGTFPHIQADLHVNWSFDSDPDDAASLPTVSFDNVQLDLGTFISNLLGPVVSKIQDVLNPILPVLTFLNGRVPIVSDIAGKDISWAELLIGDGSLLNDLTGGGNISYPSMSGTSANFGFIQELLGVAELANEIPVNGGNVFVPLGGFSLAGTDLRNSASDVSKLQNFAQTTVDDVKNELSNLAGDGNSNDSLFSSLVGDSEDLGGAGGGFDFPLFDDPTQAFRLLLGQDVSLVTFTPPQLDFSKNFSFNFSPFWPLTLGFGGDLSGQSHIEFGYDTHGLHQFLSDGDALDLLDGFYVSSSGNDENGTALPELNLHIDLYASGGADADVASLEVKGQLNVDVDASLNDPNKDGKVHPDEMAYELKNAQDLGDKILSIVDITGSIGWEMDIEGSVGPLSKSFTIASGTIADFDTNSVRNGITLSDRFESNDTQATAADLGVAPGIHVSGISLHAAADKDYYKFAIVRPGSLNVTLNYASSETAGAMEFDVLDASGNVVASGRGSGDNVVATLANAQPGTYYVKVFGAGQGVAGSYSLAFDPAPGSNQHVYYVNDGSTANSYYTSAAGSDSNSGTDSAHPKATIQSILSSYVLGPNDIIVVDSGTYTAAVLMAAAQAGVAMYSAPQGQTILQNTSITLAGGGTLLYGFGINNVAINVTDNGGSGIVLTNNAFIGSSQLQISGAADIEGNTFGVTASPALHATASSGEAVVVKGNSFTNSAAAIDVDGSGTDDIEQNVIVGATAYGIQAAGGDGSLIDGNTIGLTSAIAGILVSGGAFTISDNKLNGLATYGIDIASGNGDSVLNNSVTGAATGIYSAASGAISVNNNTVNNSTASSVNLANTISADVKGNTLSPLTGAAIEIGGGAAHTVSQNTINGRGTTAIWLQNSASGSIDYNVIAAGYATDIEADGSGTSEASYNQLIDPTTYALYFSGGGSHSISRNSGDTSNASAVIRADGGVNVIQSNTFTGSALRGIYLAQSAYGQADYNSFATLSTTGIEIDGTGATSITNNSFSGASVYGIDVPNAANVVVQNNTLSTNNSTAQGIRLDAAGGSNVSGNQLSGSGAIGIHLGATASSPVVSNTINGYSTSIQVDGPAAADVESNTLSGSSTCGIYVVSAASIKAISNQITANNNAGIEYDGPGAADVESNHLQGTRTTGINLKLITGGTLFSNQVTTSGGTGISAAGSGAMDVENNMVSGSNTFGIVLSTTAGATLKSNQATSVSGGGGIQASAASVSTLFQNSVSGAGADAIKVTATSVGLVTGNSVTTTAAQSFSRGIVLATSTTGAIIGNSVSGAGTGIEFDGAGSLDFETNTLSRSISFGLYAPAAVGATVLTNSINASSGSGVWIGGAGSADIENNPAIKGTSVYGIYLPAVTTATVKNNALQMNAGAGVEIQAGSSEVISGNAITGQGSFGIYLTINASGVIKQNTVSVSGSTTIRYDSTTVAADIESNTLSNSSVYGIYLPGIGGSILSNTIAAGGGTGIEADGPTAVDIEGNSGSGFNGYAIRVTNATTSTIHNNGPVALAGAQVGIEVDAGATSVVGNTLTGSANYGIYFGPPVTGPITLNTVNVADAHGIWYSNTVPADIENNTVAGAGQHGIYVPSATASTITGNFVAGTGSSFGIRVDTGTTLVSHNIVAGAGAWGIYLPTATTATVTDNEISGQTTGLYSDRGNAVVYGNKIHDNATGILSRGQVGGSDWSDPNLIYNNTTGVNLPVSTTLQFNRVYNNSTAVAAGPFANINHNVIYRNATAAILASAANAISVVNNTIYAPAGDAIRLVAASTGATIENNILWSQAGYDLYVSLDSVSGLASDYNNLYTTAAGKVAFDVIDFTDILDWMLASGQDGHSIGTTRPNPTLDNPQFANLAGDDYHLTAIVSTSIDGGDPATPYSLEPAPNGGRADLGAYGNTLQASASPASFLYLDSPRMYVDWVASSFQYIAWHSFNVPGNIKIEVDKEGAGKVADIATVPVTDGKYLWSPQTSGLPADDSRYRIKITSVSNSAVSTSSREAFAVPNQTHSYYVNDSSSAGDVYTTALGDNRNTGTSPADPKPSIAAVLRPYDLGAQDTINVDTGHYIELQNLIISGDSGVGDDEGVTITGPADPAKAAILDRAYPFNGAYAMELDNADFTTVEHLTLTGGEIGLWVENGSTFFTGTNLTVAGNTHDGIRIEADSVAPTLDSITAASNGRYGIYSSTTIPAIEHSVIANNADTGLYLSNPGAVEVGADSIYGNGTGIYLFEGGSPLATIGDPTLSDGNTLGNLIYANTADGIDASGDVLISGNAVYGQSGGGRWGINFSGGTAIDNDVYSNANGIISYGATLTANRVYANSNVGIDLYYGSTVSQNVVYSNAIGIYVTSGSTIGNNLVYGNSSEGIQLAGASGTHLLNNTVYQPAGDAVHIAASSSVDVRNNILWTMAGADVFVASDSQSGFTSDYNLLYATAGGIIGVWQGLNRSNLNAWRNASFTDTSSLSQDPLFVSATGADGILGYASTAADGRDDDFHLQSASGAPTGPGFAPILGSGGLPTPETSAVVNSTATSPAIDRGDGTTPFNLEPSPNGGFVDLGAYGDTAQASRSAAAYVHIVSPDGGEVWPQGQTFTIQWRTEKTNSQGTGAGTDTYRIDLMRVGSSTPVLNIVAATNNAGQYQWTVPATLNPESDYQIRVTRQDSVVGISDEPFTVAAPIHLYYVNDSTVNPGDYTTAAGDDANDGLSPATPKASIRSVLAAYHLTANDVILVDAGNYTLDSNVVITSDDAGVTIRGFTGPGGAPATFISRNNTAGGAYAFELQGASNITLDHLDISGGQYGVFASSSSASTHDTISNSVVHGNTSANVYLQSSNDFPTLTGNTFFGVGLELDGNNAVFTNNTIHDSYNGAFIFSSSAVVTGNTAYNISTGSGALGVETYGAADVENNVLHDNNYGIWTDSLAGLPVTVAHNILYNNFTGGAFNGDTIATNNQVYGNSSVGLSGGADLRGNTVYDNGTGLSTDGLTENNYVYGNAVGIASRYSGPVQGNHVYNNVVGITASSGAVANNLLYANTTAVQISGGSSGSLVNNTIIQSAASDAVLVSSQGTLTIRNNIFDIRAAVHALNVATDSVNGLNSDYNNFHLAGGASVAIVGATNYAALPAWNFQLDLDRHSQSGDPLLNPNPAGADGIVGAVGGINAAFYNSTDLSGPVVYSRVDSQLNFNFGSTPPGNGINGQAFSARWTGYLDVPASGVYTFYAVADDGVRLYLDGSTTALIDQWNYIGNATDTATVTLAPGVHPIEVDYRQLGGGANLSVSWSGPGLTQSILSSTVVSPVAGVLAGNYGADDNFNVVPGSPTIDAGDPSFAFLNEPVPNGGRINLGFTGNTPQAVTSTAQTLQVLLPNGLEKLTAYDPVRNPVTVPISVRSAGLTLENPVVQVDAGAVAATGVWVADTYHLGNLYTSGIGGTIDLSKITRFLAPASMYGSFAYPANSNTLSYLLPVSYDSDNSYNLTLEFVEPNLGAGQRTFNIVVNGTVVATNFDIAAKAGGINKAIEAMFNVSAAAGQGIRVDLVQTSSSNVPVLTALALTHVNVGGVANPTVSLSYSTDGGSTYTPIASGVALDSSGAATFNWQVPATYTSNALIKVMSEQVPGVFDTSDQPFLITPATQTYYLNDGSTAGDVYTTAIGSDTNTGKSPDSPMASLAALLAAYASNFRPGDVIEIDSGYYPLQSNITLTAAEQGIALLGPAGAGATFDRQSTSGGSEAFTLINAGNVTIENLSITGGQFGIYAGNPSDSDNVTIQSCIVYGNSNTGISFDSSNDNLNILNNTLYNEPSGISLTNDRNPSIAGNLVHDTSNTGIFAEGQNILGTNNTAYNAGTGMWFYNINPGPGDVLNVTGNTVYNDFYGLVLNGIGTASGNIIHDTTNVGASVGGTLFTGNIVYRNPTGINNEGSIVSNNRVYLNSVGITTEFGGTILANSIYNNTYGISTSAGITVANNRIYDNTQYGIWLRGGSGGSITNNTLVQTAGDDIRLDDASGMTIENNILQTSAGYGMELTDAAENGTHSDYNLFNATGPAAMVNWGDTALNSPAALYYATGQDQHSHSGNPGFINPAGADGLLGYLAGGLTGSYYSSTDLSGPVVVSQLDSNFYNVNYGTSAPVPGLPPTTYSIRWVGYIDVPAAGSYTFNETVDDGLRLYLNGSATPLIDQWNYDSGRLHTATITLSAGWQPIEIDYHNTGGGGGISLTWSGPNFGTLPIYDSALSPNPATLVGGDYGADDSFQLAAGSLAIDAGDPSSPYLNEPANDGARVDQGAYGNTPQAFVDPSRTLAVLSPGDLQKLQPGQPANIAWQFGGVGLEPIVRINSGGPAVGGFQSDIDMIVSNSSSGVSTPVNMSGVSGATPLAVYQDYDYSAGSAGSELAYQFPVPDGTYTIVLNFADDNVGGANQRTFNILLNGNAAQSAFDIYAAAGGRDRAIDKTYTVNVSGGKGLHVELVNIGNGAAILSGLELYRNTGVAVPAAMQVDVSTDNGQTWHTITTAAVTDGAGHGSFSWDPTGYVTNGNTAILRVTGGGLTAYSDGTFLIAPPGNAYYVNDGFTGGDVYSSAAGNNASSGKTPADPVASISVLLDNYILGPGTTVYVDSGEYDLYRSIVLPAIDSGVRIIGPAGSTPAANAYRDMVNAEGPVAYYRLGDAAGSSTAADFTGNNFAAYSAGVTLGAAGPLAGDSNTAASFDGVSGHVTLPSGFADFSQGLTFELWAYPTLVNNNQAFIELGDGAAGNRIVFGRSGITNNLIFQIYNGTSLVSTVTAANAIQLNAWQNFAVTMTPPSNGSGTISLYKNGQLVGSGSVTMPTVVTRTTNYLGQSTGAGDRLYAGLLDEVAIYSHPVSDLHLYAHYLAASRPVALIDRDSSNYDVFTNTGASNLDIQSLTIAGGYDGIDAPNNAVISGLRIQNNTIFGNRHEGVYIGSGATQSTVAGNEMFALTYDGNANQGTGVEIYGYGTVVSANNIHDSSNYGVFMSAGGASITTNQLWNNYFGAYLYFAATNSGDPALLSGNVVHNNSTGMIVYYAALVSGNTAYANSGIGLTLNNTTAQGNTAFGNGTGISSSGSTLQGNIAYSNGTGIAADDSTVLANKSYSNSVGIDLGSASNQLVMNNLVYANTEEGIWVHGGSGDRLLSNTVFQAVGDALRLESVSSITAHNNILDIQSGRAVYTASIGAGADLDYNDLFISSDPNASIGLFNGTAYTTLAAWQAASGRDMHSISADPKFVDPDGADNILGVATNGSNVNGGGDDNFSLAAGSPAIDSGDSWNTAPADATGIGRQDDSGTPNTGSTDYFAADTGSNSFTAGGVAQGWHGSSGSMFQLNLPFTFPFFGANYNVAWVSPSGFIQVGSNSSDTSTAPAHVNLYPRIAALWDNLSTASGDIYLTSSGSQVTLRWAATRVADNSAVNFAMTLFSDGSIRFDYGSGNASGTPVIGLLRGDNLVARLASISGATNLTGADSILFTAAPGYVDMGAFEFRGSSTDTSGPTITDVTPIAISSGGFITAPLGSIDLTFSEPINAIDALAAANYDLRSPGPDGQYNTPDDVIVPFSITYDGARQVTLTPTGLVPSGALRLTVRGSSGAAIHDLAGNSLDGDANGQPGGDFVRTFTVGSVVIDREIFYNDSAFDGNNPAATIGDDNAIDTSKQALLPGQTATFANYTSYTNGINGIIIDISGLPAGGLLSAADFGFVLGNDVNPAGWTAAASLPTITVRSGAGPNHSDRIELIWADGAIVNQWLKVTMLATANTGLLAPDIFYFGNTIGESGNSPANATVNSADELAARARLSLAPVSVTSAYDYNRDGFIDTADVLAARGHQTAGSSVLQLITAPAAPRALEAVTVTAIASSTTVAAIPIGSPFAATTSQPSPATSVSSRPPLPTTTANPAAANPAPKLASRSNPPIVLARTTAPLPNPLPQPETRIAAAQKAATSTPLQGTPSARSPKSAAVAPSKPNAPLGAIFNDTRRIASPRRPSATLDLARPVTAVASPALPKLTTTAKTRA